MYYFNYKKDTVEKYLVSFDKEEIERLRIEIINNCSEIEHKEYDGFNGPNYFDYLKIRNYKEKFLRIQESRDSLQMPDRKIYHYSYDEHKFPILISVIDNLLKEDVLSLESIFNNNSLLFEKPINERIKIASDELDSIDNLDLDKKRKKLEELQRLAELKKLNKNQKSIEPYFGRLKELIQIQLIDTISFEEIRRVNNFFGKEENFKKVLKIIK